MMRAATETTTMITMGLCSLEASATGGRRGERATHPSDTTSHTIQFKHSKEKRQLISVRGRERKSPANLRLSGGQLYTGVSTRDRASEKRRNGKSSLAKLSFSWEKQDN